MVPAISTLAEVAWGTHSMRIGRPLLSQRGDECVADMAKKERSGWEGTVAHTTSRGARLDDGERGGR